MIRNLASLGEVLGSVTTIHSSSSRGSRAFFWPPVVPDIYWYRDVCSVYHLSCICKTPDQLPTSQKSKHQIKLETNHRISRISRMWRKNSFKCKSKSLIDFQNIPDSNQTSLMLGSVEPLAFIYLNKNISNTQNIFIVSMMTPYLLVFFAALWTVTLREFNPYSLYL